MDLVLSGSIKSTAYDKVVDLDRIEFEDKKNKMSVYLEYPRLGNVTKKLNENDPISVTITDSKKQEASKDTKMVLNTTLYMIRKADDNKGNIVQFSSGGILLRLVSTSKKVPFRLRGNRIYKILIN